MHARRTSSCRIVTISLWRIAARSTSFTCIQWACALHIWMMRMGVLARGDTGCYDDDGQHLADDGPQAPESDHFSFGCRLACRRCAWQRGGKDSFVVTENFLSVLRSFTAYGTDVIRLRLRIRQSGTHLTADTTFFCYLRTECAPKGQRR